MNLEGLLALINESNPEDWYTISQGPTFRDQLNEITSNMETGGKKDEHWIELNSHHTTAVYRPDIAITISFGMSWQKDFDEPWAKKCPDPHASGYYVDVYYYGALVYRDVYVTVDGGRAKLPIPKSRTELIVPQGYHQFIRLINSIQGPPSQYDEYFGRVGLQIGDGKWPKI